ncbi:mitoguardin [Bacillus rossius redtenbacheri]|uniref:mitoguardin n=1 Tax=Bacillus rossius redtenbacheri TaxID=93214 RepID=UPI002FDE506E
MNMPVVNKVNPILARLPSIMMLRNVRLSTPQKVTVVSVTLGVALLGFLARYLRRKRRIVNPSRDTTRKHGTSGIRSPASDAASQASRRSASPSVRSLHRQASLLSERLASLGAAQGGGDFVVADVGAHLTPQQLGVMGMEALETAINYWDDALAAYTSGGGAGAAGAAGAAAVTTAEEAQFCRDLQRLVDAAYELQDQCELLFLDQRSVLFHTDTSSRHYGDALSSFTSAPESFASAQDEIADLREFEEFAECFPDAEELPLYQEARAQFESAGIPYRTLRTETVHCSSDLEFLCKLHCVRLALQLVFRDRANWRWLADTGRQVLADILIFADKDPKDLLIAYEDMLEFIKQEENWTLVEQELSLKGVKAMTFYDIVLDFILMDAFDDLDSPPSTLTAVVYNRWLSNGFKETALTTAVWSLFKGKRRMLKYPDGFISHFYAISEQVLPMMAWGFLGPDENLKAVCQYFREQVTGFLIDIFSFHKCRFSVINELAEDILNHLKTRVEAIGHKLSLQGEATV